MALKKKPVIGMKDVLPAEMQIRNYVMSQIQKTYQAFGFSQIETPAWSTLRISPASREGIMKNLYSRY